MRVLAAHCACWRHIALLGSTVCACGWHDARGRHGVRVGGTVREWVARCVWAARCANERHIALLGGAVRVSGGTVRVGGAVCE